MPELTPKQRLFVAEYLKDLNATQAAIRAGYSEKTAHSQGPRLLEDAGVKSAIAAAAEKRAEKLEITAERVLAEIANMAFYDVGDLMIDGDASEELTEEQAKEWEKWIVDGRIIHGLRNPADIKRLPEKLRRAIVGWGWDRNGNFTVKLADKSKALDQLARHLSLYNDKLEVTGVDALADRLARASKRGNIDG